MNFYVLYRKRKKNFDLLVNCYVLKQKWITGKCMPSLLSIHPHTKNFLPGYLGSQHCLTSIPANWTKIFLCNCKVSMQTEPAWLTRPVWLIGLLRPSNTSNMFVKLFAQQCCVASWDCFLHILTPFCATNLLLLLFATWKIVMRRGDDTCNKQF